MNRGSPGADAAAAGAYMVSSLILCGAAGYGVGSLVGLEVAAGIVGLLAGFVAGMALVYVRYRRI
jgi:hypothetical protein